MKGLKKLVLVSAIATISSSVHAELKELDDEVMGDLTGQAGLTIELETQVDVGSLIYTDEGSLALNNIHLGGQGGTLLDDISITIDIASDGDAIIDVHSTSGSPIDFNLSIDSIELNGTSGENTLLLSNINMDGFLTKLNMTVDTATDTLNGTVGFYITDQDMDIDFLAVGIKDVTVGSDNSTGLVTDTEEQAIVAATGSAFIHSSLSKSTNSNAASGEALVLVTNAFELDINVGAFEIGGTSIGTLAISDLVIGNTRMEIYGH